MCVVVSCAKLFVGVESSCLVTWHAAPHDGAMSTIAACSNCSRRFSFDSSSLKISPIAHACCSNGAEPKGRIMCRRARVVAHD